MAEMQPFRRGCGELIYLSSQMLYWNHVAKNAGHSSISLVGSARLGGTPTGRHSYEAAWLTSNPYPRTGNHRIGLGESILCSSIQFIQHHGTISVFTSHTKLPLLVGGQPLLQNGALLSV
jgi:hypothetical protein